MKIVKIGAMWCPACIVTNKFWNEFKSENSNIDFVDLDIDLDEDEANKYDNLDVLPVVIVEDNGKEIKRLVGEHSKKEYEQLIKETNRDEK